MHNLSGETCEHTECSAYLIVVLRPLYGAASQILFEETLYQDGSDGTPLVEVLQRQGIVPGTLAAAETTVLQTAQQLCALLGCCESVAAQEALPVG